MYGSGRTVERCEGAVARVFDDVTSETFHDPSGFGIVTVEDVAPNMIAGRGS